jgi:hypothetical protein
MEEEKNAVDLYRSASRPRPILKADAQPFAEIRTLMRLSGKLPDVRQRAVTVR